MPIHDWTKVKPGVFHALHHGWIEEIASALNAGLLPPDFYALPKQREGGFGPDVLALFVESAVVASVTGSSRRMTRLRITASL